jgi:hypothetical protein
VSAGSVAAHGGAVPEPGQGDLVDDLDDDVVGCRE